MPRPNGGQLGVFTQPVGLAATPGVWSLRDVTQYSRLGVWPGPATTLLLNFNGSGTAITDSSTTPKTVSVFGNATQSTAQKQWGSASLYLDGSGDYLTLATSAAFGFGTGDFTIEYWWYPTRNTINETLIDNRGSDIATPLVLGKSSAGAVRCYDGSNIRTGGSMTLNAWNHVAWSRASGSNSVYLNGTRVLNFSSFFNAGVTRNLTIGANASVSFENCQGYVDDIRISKASLYSGATITVPTSEFLS